MSRAPRCAHPGCDKRVVRTGSRGPWPDRCPGHRGDRRREQTRERVRKYRLKLDEDYDSPGALWLRGERESAIALAEREQTEKLRECEALPDGYLQGGKLWDGMHLPPRRREFEEAPAPARLSDEQRDALRSSIAGQRSRAANRRPSNAECAAMMGLEAGTGLSRRAKTRLLV